MIKLMEVNISKSQSWRMFDDISPKYDFLNQLLSFGLHHVWRKKLRKFLPPGSNLQILDLATGTADVLITLCQNNRRVDTACGIDLSEKMLGFGREKVAYYGLHDVITLKHGDANHVPFEANHFDAATIAFGIRNVEDPVQVLKEMYRVLKPKGQALILEFSMPENLAMRSMHLLYLRKIVPSVGGMISGHPAAYRYLNQTIETFPYGEEFCDLMRQSGLTHVKANELLRGVATIYVGEK